MFKNLTDCNKCVKADVCSIKNKINYAVKEIAETNVTNEDRAILKQWIVKILK